MAKNVTKRARVEEVHRRKRFRTNTTRIILGTLAVSAILATAPIAPGILGAIEQLRRQMGFKTPRAKFRYYISKRVDALLDNGFIKLEREDGKKFFVLTDKGRAYLARHGSLPQKKKRWDKNWRIVIYDIWERARGKRDLLREILKNLGFQRLQNSVWISPYDSEELVFLLKTDLRLGRGVLYMTVNSIEDDYSLRKRFNLS